MNSTAMVPVELESKEPKKNWRCELLQYYHYCISMSEFSSCFELMEMKCSSFMVPARNIQSVKKRFIISLVILKEGIIYKQHFLVYWFVCMALWKSLITSHTVHVQDPAPVLEEICGDIAINRSTNPWKIHSGKLTFRWDNRAFEDVVSNETGDVPCIAMLVYQKVHSFCFHCSNLDAIESIIVFQ